MKKAFLYLLLIASISGTFTSCKKYEDGPALSLRSKKARLCQTWKTESYTENGVDKTSDWNSYYQSATMTFKKDDTYALYYKTLGLFDYNESGIWSLTASKLTIIFNKTKPTNDTYDWRIKRLTKDELWVEDVLSNGVVSVLKMIPQ